MEAIGTGAVANLCSGTITGIFRKIKRHVRYVFIQKKNVEKFEKKMKLLMEKRAAVQRKVDAARRNLETINEDVNRWCQQVDDAINEEEKNLKDLVERAKAKCFIGLCPNIKSRYKLSRKTEEYVAAIDKLLQDGQFDNVGLPYVPEALISAAPENLTEFDSTKKIFNQIVEALKDPTISMIGVYGTGGVGKTTLVNEVARHVKEIDLFCPVVVVTVTLIPKIKNIQERIAVSLGLKLEEYGESVRADMLSKRLKEEKKILIVLDDIWGGSDLKKVGIPFGDQYKGCKILLTSRDLHKLTKEMGVKTTFAMDVLEENEAWKLFKKMVEINDFENSELESVATDIVKRCAGLPLAIVTVAGALRNEKLAVWTDALLQLQRPSPGNFTGIPEEVYSAIQLSYENLKSEELKKTFLLSCLLGRNARIEDLLRCAMGLRLFDGVNTVEQTRNRVLTMVSKLKASCLLLDGDNDDCLVMHDLVWDVALAIASRDNHAYALRHGDVFEEWPDEDKRQKFKMICLNFASIKNLPHQLDCPHLTLFSMASRGWNSYVEMPPSYFEKTKDIKVIDLIGMDFSSSSSSVSLPTSLRTLCLKRCRLGDMGSLGKLTNLEILNLSESDIEVLPKQIGQLKKLRSLDLTDCRKLEKIPPGVLSSLSKLEELYMGGETVGWNREDNARLDELKELSEKLERYVILIGVEPVSWHMWKRFEYSRVLAVKLNSTVDHLDDGIKGLMKKTKALKLEGEGSTSVPQHELPLFGKQIELPCLEDLYLFKIDVVGRIWHKQFSTLENLTSLRISNCDNLKGIFSSSMVKNLTHLKRFEISECKHLREIIFSEDIEEDDNVTISFPQLSTLEMENLGHLIGFCSENYNLAFPSLKALNIRGCPKLNGFIYKSKTEDGSPLSMQALFDEKIELPCLEDLYLSKIDVVGRIWHKQFSTLENLTNLNITNCDNLKYILSPSTAKSLAHLQSFGISNCKRLREIIFSEDIEEEEDNVTISFPQLSTLRMTNLRHFIVFCSENYNLAFPSLKELSIFNCPKLNGFIYKSTTEDGSPLSMQALFDEKATFPQLEELQLWDLKNCRKIWSDQFVGDSFSKLKSLGVFDCAGLMNIFSFNTRERLQNLVKLTVIRCDSLEEIFEPQILSANQLDATTATPSITEKTTTSFVFPKLTSLYFDGMPKLKSFYSKIHTTSWPLLKEMRLSGSDMMEIVFASESLSFGELTNQQPLFWVNEVTFPNLEVLELQRIPREIWHGQLRTDVFNKLRVLTLEGFPDTSPNLPNCFIPSLPNLERLVVSDAAFSGNEIDASVTSINELSLVKLPHLTHLWKEEYNLCGAFCKLRSLKVRDCAKLKNLVPSSVLFENLTTLEVSTCHGFVNLMTCSIAKSLVQLTSMSIADCEMIKEIIASECDEVNGGIVFTCLKYLRLKGLPSLASFCSRKHSFEFPTLEKVSVVGCPEMKIFSQGDLSTPILQRVQFNANADEGRWEGCLNSTIQWSFTEKVGYNEISDLSLFDSSKWMEIWRSPRGIVSFKSLQFLKVDDCSTLRCLFTVSIASDLPQLFLLQVKNCSVMEHIILDNGPDEEVEKKIVFPQLRFIILESCADLASFYQGSTILKFPDLGTLQVIDCPKMFAFASTFSREQSTETIDDGGNTSRLSVDVAFFNNMVEFPDLRYLMIKHLGNCKKIWHDHLIDDSFSNLWDLEVWNCDKLLNVFSINMSRRLWQLEELVVGRCDSLEEIFEPQVLNADELHTETATESIVFTILRRLQLSCLPSLACFCSGKHNFEFPALEKMVVSECPKMKIFCQGDLSTPQLQKVILAEDEDEDEESEDEDEKIWRWEGNLNTTIQRVFEEMNVQNPEEH